MSAPDQRPWTAPGTVRGMLAGHSANVLAKGSLDEVNAVLEAFAARDRAGRAPRPDAYPFQAHPVHALLDNPAWRALGPARPEGEDGGSAEPGPGGGSDPAAGWAAALNTLLKTWGTAVVDGNQDTPLHKAAGHGAIGAVRLLLAAGADPLARNSICSTPLHVAAHALHATVVQALLDHGVPVDVRPTDHVRGTPLMEALRAEIPGDGASPAQTAGWFARRRAVVDALLAAGADPAVRDHQGVDLLSRAVMGSQTPMVDTIAQLVAAGASPTVRDRNGQGLGEQLEEEIDHLLNLATTVPMPSTLARLRVRQAHRDAWRAALVEHEQAVLRATLQDLDASPLGPPSSMGPSTGPAIVERPDPDGHGPQAPAPDPAAAFPSPSSGESPPRGRSRL